MGAIHLIALGMGQLWTMVRSRLFKDQGSGSWAGFTAGAEAAARRRYGVEENITLPATGTLFALCSVDPGFRTVLFFFFKFSVVLDPFHSNKKKNRLCVICFLYGPGVLFCLGLRRNERLLVRKCTEKEGFL